ncbi:hypothetical protein [Massilia sp.]|uniref:hypothetical protein n=1 Tax=Massilia sp. TaxID=1882437 RepID=UPI0028A94B9A|nr:hypothetical protein [Massilia sp.]
MDRPARHDDRVRRRRIEQAHRRRPLHAGAAAQAVDQRLQPDHARVALPWRGRRLVRDEAAERGFRGRIHALDHGIDQQAEQEKAEQRQRRQPRQDLQEILQRMFLCDVVVMAGQRGLVFHEWGASV